MRRRRMWHKRMRRRRIACTLSHISGEVAQSLSSEASVERLTIMLLKLKLTCASEAEGLLIEPTPGFTHLTLNEKQV